MSIVLIVYIVLAALLLIFVAVTSKRSWLLILLLLMPIRDLQLAGLFGGGTLKIGDIFIALLFGLWLAHDVLLKKKTKFLKSNLDLYILLFIVFYVIALAWSMNLDLGLVRVTKLMRNYFLYVLIREIFIWDFKDSFKKAAFAYALTSIVISVVYFLSAGKESLSSLFSLSHKESIAATDLLNIRAITTGGGILINGPQIWLMLASCFIYGSLMITKSKPARIVKFGLIGVFIFAAITTLNRSVMGLMGVIAAVLFIGSWNLKIKNARKWILVLCLCLLVGGTALRLPQIFLKRFTNVSQDQAWLERGDLAKSAIDAFRHSPVIGIGPGSNMTWEAKFRPDPSRFVDNFYLTVLSEVGLIGFLLLLMMLYYWLKYLVTALRLKIMELPLKNMVLAVLAFSVGFLFIALVGQEIESLEPWIMMGIAAAVKALYFPQKLAPRAENEGFFARYFKIETS
jgi:O-antigen ligase